MQPDQITVLFTGTAEGITAHVYGPSAPTPSAYLGNNGALYADIREPLEQRGLPCSVDFGADDYVLVAELPDGSHLTISPPPERSGDSPPAWLVTRTNPDEDLFEVVYDSEPGGAEAVNGGSRVALVAGIYARLDQLGVPTRHEMDAVQARAESLLRRAGFVPVTRFRDSHHRLPAEMTRRTAPVIPRTGRTRSVPNPRPRPPPQSPSSVSPKRSPIVPASSPNALPEVAIGRHPEHGIVAALPTQSAAAEWMLERLDFQRIPGHPTLFTLTDQHREAAERTGWAVKLLKGAGFRVDADGQMTPEVPNEQAKEQARPLAPESRQPPAADPGPDVAFAEHPRLGLVAAVGGNQPLSPAIYLETDGWLHHRQLDIYLPPAATRAESLDAVTRATVALQRGNYQVAMQPQLADAITAHRDDAAPQSFTTHTFRVNEAALAKSPARRPGSPTTATVPTGPPPAAVDPRVAFARVR